MTEPYLDNSFRNAVDALAYKPEHCLGEDEADVLLQPLAQSVAPVGVVKARPAEVISPGLKRRAEAGGGRVDMDSYERQAWSDVCAAPRPQRERESPRR